MCVLWLHDEEMRKDIYTHSKSVDESVRPSIIALHGYQVCPGLLLACRAKVQVLVLACTAAEQQFVYFRTVMYFQLFFPGHVMGRHCGLGRAGPRVLKI